MLQWTSFSTLNFNDANYNGWQAAQCESNIPAYFPLLSYLGKDMGKQEEVPYGAIFSGIFIPASYPNYHICMFSDGLVFNASQALSIYWLTKCVLNISQILFTLILKVICKCIYRVSSLSFLIPKTSLKPVSANIVELEWIVILKPPSKRTNMGYKITKQAFSHFLFTCLPLARWNYLLTLAFSTKENWQLFYVIFPQKRTWCFHQDNFKVKKK